MRQATISNIIELAKIAVPVAGGLLAWYVSTIITPLSADLIKLKEDNKVLQAEVVQSGRALSQMAADIETLKKQMVTRVSADLMEAKYSFILQQLQSLNNDYRELRNSCLRIP